MLYLIGLGLKPKHLTLEALDAIKACDQVMVETYTSFYSQGKISDLEELTGKKVHGVARDMIEQEMQSLVLSAKNNNVALLVFGNPLTATTHTQLLLESKKHAVKIKIVEGISVTNALSRTGLDEYKFGRTTTIVEPKKGFAPASFYDFIEKNQKLGLHTLCLLDTNDGERFQNASQALEILEQIEKKKKKKILKNSVIVVCAGLTSEREKIFVGDIESAKKFESKEFPQSIIVCGKLNEKEKEALKELHGFDA